MNYEQAKSALEAGDQGPGMREIMTGVCVLTPAEEHNLKTGTLVCVRAKDSELAVSLFAEWGMASNLEAPCDQCGEVIHFRPWGAIALVKICAECFFQRQGAVNS